jgi:hypothetical protein
VTPRVLVLGLIGILACLACLMEKDATAAPRRAVRLATTHPADDQLHVLATVRPVRQIAMFYKLDLARDNALSKTMAGVMRENEHRIRGCYVERLEARPKLRGRLDLRFQVSKATGTMQWIARAGGNLSDPRLLRCVKQQLALLPFNPPRDLQGTLQYTFGVVGMSQGMKGVRATATK